MKRPSLLFLILFLVPNPASAFVESRHQWWEIRLKNVKDERARLATRNALDPRVIELLENEASRARDIIATLESDMRDDGSLTHVAKIFSDAEVTTEVDRVVTPLFALSVMEILMREQAGAESQRAAREVVNRRLIRAISTASGREDGELARRIMAVEIRPDDWSRITTEIFMGRLMAGWKHGEALARREVAFMVREKLRAKNGPSNGRELRHMAMNTAMEFMRGRGTVDYCMDTEGALERAWSWRLVQSLIERGLSAHEEAMALITSLEGISPERYSGLYKSFLELDSLIFKTRHGDFLLEKNVKPRMHGMDGYALPQEIPDVPQNLAPLVEMDRIRSAALHSLTGREDRKCIEETGYRLKGVVERHNATARDLFSRQEEKARLSTQKGRSEAVANEAEFIAARKLFEKQASFIDAYGKKSLEFLELVWKAKKIESFEIMDHYRYRVARSREYMQFAVELSKECARLAPFDDNRLHGRYRAAMGALGPLFHFIGTSLNIERELLPYLAVNDIATIRGLKTECIGAINSTRGSIRGSFAKYGRGRSRTLEGESKARKRLEETIAHVEIDALAKRASECAALYRELSYAADALAGYAVRLNALHEEAKNDALSDEIEYAAKMGSLVPLIKGFDRARIDREYLTKRYLVNETRTALARLKTMLRFYKKNGTPVRDEPSVGEIEGIEKLIAMKTAVKIDAWEMNEANISEVDRKAAAKLSLMLRRKTYAPGKENGARKTGGRESALIV
ncbi:MAG: hypothetical protein E4G96_07345, partial [Chrysiogenales bacterium]